MSSINEYICDGERSVPSKSLAKYRENMNSQTLAKKNNCKIKYRTQAVL